MPTKSDSNSKKSDANEFAALFDQLKQILVAYAPYMTVKDDSATEYTLVAPFRSNPAKRFGGVAIRQTYVTFYSCPDILKGASAKLKKNMQGTASLNFTKADDALIQEVGKLTAKRFKNFQAGSW